MGDFSFRAVDVLKSVALVLAEDTRHTRHLLDRYEISDAPRVVPRAQRGENRRRRSSRDCRPASRLALVSDAGTPLLSDPGARLVRAAIEAGVAVLPIPGASALLAALVVSGLDADALHLFRIPYTFWS